MPLAAGSKLNLQPGMSCLLRRFSLLETENWTGQSDREGRYRAEWRQICDGSVLKVNNNGCCCWRTAVFRLGFGHDSSRLEFIIFFEKWTKNCTEVFPGKERCIEFCRPDTVKVSSLVSILSIHHSQHFPMEISVALTTSPSSLLWLVVALSYCVQRELERQPFIPPTLPPYETRPNIFPIWVWLARLLALNFLQYYLYKEGAVTLCWATACIYLLFTILIWGGSRKVFGSRPYT